MLIEALVGRSWFLGVRSSFGGDCGCGDASVIATERKAKSNDSRKEPAARQKVWKRNEICIDEGFLALGFTRALVRQRDMK